MFKVFFKTVIMTLASCVCVAAGATTPSPLCTVEGISAYRLDNGLQVVLFPDMSKPTATVNTTYLVGSRHESYGETGMAHLLEHLMFKGSQNYPDPSKEFTRRGFRMNGTTWLDRTNYFVSFTATDDNMRWALGWSADAMVNSFIAKKDLDTEMTVVRNEYEMGENKPVSVMIKRMQSMIFDCHNYGHSTIGARSDIENVPIENLQAFYHKWYQPDNAVLTVSGRFEKQKVLGWIEETFGRIPKPTRALPREWTVEPVADGAREFEIRRPGEMQFVAVSYRIPSAMHEDTNAIETAIDILSEAPRGRLYKELVETGLATQVFGWSLSAKAPSFAMFGAFVKKGEPLAPVKEKLIEVVETAFSKSPATEAEVKTSLTEAATEFERTLSDPEAFAVDLSDYIALGDWRLFFLDRDRTARVRAQDVNAVVARYFVRDNRIVGSFIPDATPRRAPAMTTPTLESVLAGVHFNEKGEEAEAFDSTQENIMKRTERFSVGQVEVALLPKKTRGKTVTVATKFLYGNITVANGKRVLDILLEPMLERGAQGLDKKAIADRMTAAKMQGDVFSFTSTRDKLTEALELMGTLTTTSTLPVKEFKQYVRQLATTLEGKSDDPITLSRDAIAKAFATYPVGDPRNPLPSSEILSTLKGIEHQALKAWYEDVFSTQNGAIAIVGDFDSTEVKRVLHKVLGAKKANGQKNAFERFYAQFKEVKAQRIVLDAPDKENAALLARIDFPANAYGKEAPAMSVANWILGGGTALTNRLMSRLRQKEGLSYSVYSHLALPKFGDRAYWMAFAIVAPQNLQKAESAMREELERALSSGFTPEEVAEAKKGLLDYRAVNRAQDDYLAQSWLSFMDSGKDFTFSREFERQIDALTTDEVNAALRQMIDMKRVTFVLAGDLKKSPKLQASK